MSKPSTKIISSRDNGNGISVDWRDVALCVVLLLATLTFWKVYVDQRLTLPIGPNFRAPDMLSYFYPKFIYGNEVLNQGRFPLWNPYEYCGIPFAATLQPEVFYPFKYLVFSIFSPPTAIEVFIGLHIFLNALFTYFFFRTIQISKIASLLGSMIWAFSAPFAFGSLNHPTRFAAIAWFPFCMTCLHMLFARRTPLWGALLAVGTALMFLAGVPQFMISSLVFMLFFYFFLVAHSFLTHDESALTNLAEIHILLLVSSVLCIFLVACQLFPFYEMLSLSDRATGAEIARFGYTGTSKKLGLKWLIRLAVQWKQLPGTGRSLFFIGITSFVLSSFGLVFSGKSIKYFFLLGGMLLLAIPFFPKFYWLLHKIPPFSLNRFPFSWLFFWSFFVAGLVAVGLDYLLTRHEPDAENRPKNARDLALTKHTVSFLIPYSVILFSLFNFLIIPGYEIAIMFLTSACIIALLLLRKQSYRIIPATLIVMLSILAYTTQIATNAESQQLPNTSIEELRNSPIDPHVRSFHEQNEFSRVYSIALLYNAKQLFSKIGLINGYEGSLKMKRISRILHFYNFIWARGFGNDGARIENWDKFVEKPGILDLMGTGLILVPQAGVELFLDDESRFEILGETEEYVAVANKRAMPRSFLVHSSRTMKDENEIFEKLRDSEIDLSLEVVLEEDLPDTVVLEHPAETEAPPRIITYMPEEVVIEAEPKAGAFLVLSDSYYPGWKAYDNGVEAHIYLANYLFRGVYLTPGKHTVRFSYEPDSFKWGLRISILGWTLVIGFFLYKAASLVVQYSRKRVVGETIENGG